MSGDRSVFVAVLIGIVTLTAFLAVISGGVGRSAALAPVPSTPPPGPASPLGVPVPPMPRDVYLVAFADFPPDEMEALVEHYREKFDLSIRVLPSIAIPDAAVDRERGQLIAERLLEALAAAPAVSRDPAAVVIALTDQDIYIAARDWNYAYGLRSLGTHGLVSTARMADGASPATQTQRLRKMVTKNLGILYYGLDVSDDPRSVLYRDILGPADLDFMSEDF